MSRRAAGRVSLPAALGLAAAMACSVPHEARSHLFVPENSLAKPSALEVSVRFAGGLRLGLLEGPGLYRAAVSSCDLHFVPSVAYEASSQGAARLLVGLQARHGAFLGFGGERQEVDLDLPADVPLELDLDPGEGESVIDLSRLRVRRLKLAAGAGDTRVVFGEPNPEPLREILVESALGDLSIDRLGSSGAAVTRVKGGVGAMEIDLTGPWRGDATIHIEVAVGALILRLPKGPGVRLAVTSPWREGLTLARFALRDGAFYSDGYETASPRLDVGVEAGVGELEVLQD